jgi:hypothetical protein
MLALGGPVCSENRVRAAGLEWSAAGGIVKTCGLVGLSTVMKFWLWHKVRDSRTALMFVMEELDFCRTPTA